MRAVVASGAGWSPVRTVTSSAGMRSTTEAMPAQALARITRCTSAGCATASAISPASHRETPNPGRYRRERLDADLTRWLRRGGAVVDIPLRVRHEAPQAFLGAEEEPAPTPR